MDGLTASKCTLHHLDASSSEMKTRRSELPVYASDLSDARFGRAGRQVALRAFDKSVRRKPAVFAADAGPMEIE